MAVATGSFDSVIPRAISGYRAFIRAFFCRGTLQCVLNLCLFCGNLSDVHS